MPGKIVNFPGITRHQIDPARVLEAALGEKLDHVVIIGEDANGDFYFASSKPDAQTVLFDLEWAKHRLLQVCDQDT